MTIASVPARAYGRPMATRLLHLLVLMALALMPLRITGEGAAAMEHVPTATTAHGGDHCADQGAPAEKSSHPRVDCTTACAFALPEAGGLAERREPAGEALHPVSAAAPRGVEVEADPPPPRLC